MKKNKKNNLVGKLNASLGLMRFAESTACKILRDANVKIEFRIEEYDDEELLCNDYVTENEFDAFDHIMQSQTAKVYCYIDLDNYADKSNGKLEDAISLVLLNQNTMDMTNDNDALLSKYSVKYQWVADCKDNSFYDVSRLFDTKEECYNDMRRSALDKMTWNTEWYDFDDLSDYEYIAYEVKFSRERITLESYSGLYTYKIIEV